MPDTTEKCAFQSDFGLKMAESCVSREPFALQDQIFSEFLKILRSKTFTKSDEYVKYEICKFPFSYNLSSESEQLEARFGRIRDRYVAQETSSTCTLDQKTKPTTIAMLTSNKPRDKIDSKLPRKSNLLENCPLFWPKFFLNMLLWHN
jgi:hypothetical protein